jgi:hypothetical protein
MQFKTNLDTPLAARGAPQKKKVEKWRCFASTYPGTYLLFRFCSALGVSRARGEGSSKTPPQKSCKKNLGA